MAVKGVALQARDVSKYEDALALDAFMFSMRKSHIKKVGEPPGTPTYTGKLRNRTPTVTVTVYNNQDIKEYKGTTLAECLPASHPDGMIWVDVNGLNNSTLIQEIAERFKLHPLTVEDILTVDQRPKVEEFDDYTFIELKALIWHAHHNHFNVRPLSIVLGESFVLSFHEGASSLFNGIHTRIASNPNQRLRQQGGDYLVYRLIDAVVDEYFLILEALSDKIEKLEDLIVSEPTQQNARTIYRLKRKLLVMRKVTWPVREALGHLMHAEDTFITKFTSVYLRDVYDHTVQVIDTIDTFRDMLASLLDMYLSSLTNRMNEIMKTLTIITTIFIPITAIASIYGMNFTEIPGLRWEYGYITALAAMACMAVGMLIYFKKKKWF